MKSPMLGLILAASVVQLWPYSATADIRPYLHLVEEGDREFAARRFDASEKAYAEALMQRAAAGEEAQALDPVVSRLALLVRAQLRCADRATLLRHELGLDTTPPHRLQKKAAFKLALLAYLENGTGDYGEALRLGERLLELLAPTMHDRDLAVLRTFLAFLYFAQGKVDRGQEMHIKSLKGREQSALPDPLSDALLLASGAWRDATRGDHGRAVRLFSEAVVALERIGSDHPNLASVLEGYSASLEKVGRIKQARQIRTRAKRVWTQAGAHVGCAAER